MTKQQIQYEILKVNLIRGYKTKIKMETVKESKLLFVQLREEQERFNKIFKL